MAEYKGDNQMELHKLNKGDDIWFKYPNATNSFPAVVEEFHYNFKGEPFFNCTSR